jgi:archaeal type IV pilus assembly protein PilA
MNKYFRKFKKNAKALSPVVASIILIAVTVAVSVVVAAWMGGMTIGLMGSAEQVSITNVAFPDASNIQVLVQNAGGTQGTINSAFINGLAATVSTPVGVAKSSQTIITFTNPTNASFTLTPGTSYTIKLITAKGTSVVSSATTYSP